MACFVSVNIRPFQYGGAVDVHEALKGRAELISIFFPPSLLVLNMSYSVAL